MFLQIISRSASFATTIVVLVRFIAPSAWFQSLNSTYKTIASLLASLIVTLLVYFTPAYAYPSAPLWMQIAAGTLTTFWVLYCTNNLLTPKHQ